MGIKIRHFGLLDALIFLPTWSRDDHQSLNDGSRHERQWWFSELPWRKGHNKRKFNRRDGLHEGMKWKWSESAKKFRRWPEEVMYGITEHDDVHLVAGEEPSRAVEGPACLHIVREVVYSGVGCRGATEKSAEWEWRKEEVERINNSYYYVCVCVAKVP